MAEILIGNVKGPQGEKGDTGATGPQGLAATVNVGTVSTTAYGNAAQVTNSGTENEAVLNFVIPQGKPGDKTTTMSGLTLDTITTSTADFPSPAVGDTGATAFGKIVKWFADGLSAIQAKLDAANVVNNLTTTEAGYALDARQGKALNDSLGTVSATLNKRVESNFAKVVGFGNIHYVLFGNLTEAQYYGVIHYVVSNGSSVLTGSYSLNGYANTQTSTSGDVKTYKHNYSGVCDFQIIFPSSYTHGFCILGGSIADYATVTKSA